MDELGQVTSLALDFRRMLGELERAGTSVFEDCTRKHEAFELEERLLDLPRAQRTAGVS